jgi:hypothetical protein
MKQKSNIPTFITHMLILLSFLFLNGCQNINLPEPTSQAILPTLIPTPTLYTTATPNILGSGFKLDNYILNIPKDWFYTVINDNQMNGWAFTLRDPEITAVSGLDGWVGGLWIISPLPSGIISDDLTSNLSDQISKFSESDFAAILLPASQAGFLDLNEAEIQFEIAEKTNWVGKDCLKMTGKINYGSSENELSAVVYLMWTDRDFISYYQFSDTALRPEFDPIFRASRESLIIP